MELSGPSFCQIKDGEPCNKWMITSWERTPKGTSYDIFYFSTEQEADTYLKYLNQCYGVEDLQKKIHNNRTFKWEIEEYKEFLASLDLNVLIDAVKDIKFIKEHKFYPSR